MARIVELLGQGPTLSFEFFPPKSDVAERQLQVVIEELAPLEPTFVSVTYGAGGSTRERTRDVVVRICKEQAFPAMAHLTCVGHRRADIDALLDDYAANGVENILALAGDPPADGSEVPGDFRYASELIEVVRGHPAGFSVGVAAHPELHPRSADRADDRRWLAAKLATVDFGVTNFFFTVEPYLAMMEELAALGCTTPVIPGVMPIGVFGAGSVRRMSAMNGTAIPAGLEADLDRFADDPPSLIEVGVELASELSRQLLDAGVPGLHLYALNRSYSVCRIVENLGLN
jgi:methylenetetrahydrofolate reductase (NADPH)